MVSTMAFRKRVGVPECCNSNVDIDNNAQGTFKIVGLLVSQKVTDHQDTQDQHDNVEEVEVQVHSLVQSPAD